MEYDLTSKKMESSVNNVGHRSGYGDMHSTRDALMNTEHVTFLRQHRMIETAMAVELMKPLHRGRQYTEAYLATHPDYTGIQPEMTALSTAERHQEKRDKEMEKFIEDYEAGRIDEDGNPVSRDGDGVVHGAVNKGHPRPSLDPNYDPANPSRVILRKRLRKLPPNTVAHEPEAASEPARASESSPPAAAWDRRHYVLKRSQDL
ncbi:hypothetical protein SVAN01_01165 [Stagonosporopsis vannaccii]|nr:hypothetical protein SVAN01_01165 [Stagonosporopsis vannaccii]